MTTQPGKQPVVVIVGAGFGGLRVAQELKRVPVDVLLVDRHNYHLFQPLLYQVATAGLEPEAIAQPVRAIVRQRNFDFRLAQATGVDFGARRLLTGDGPIDYDFLVLAMGAAANFYGLAGVERHGLTLKDIPDAVRLRNHVLSCFEEAMFEPDPERRRALLTFVVVGGGPTGVEMAGSLSELIRLVLVKDYRRLDLKDVRILLLEAGSRVLNGFPPRLAEAAARTLWRKHVEVRHGATVSDFDGTTARLKSGEVIPARTLVWAAGVQATPLARQLGVPTAHLGRVVVEPTLQVPGHPEVFVIGDAAYLQAQGPSLPMMAPVALQMGTTVARSIRRIIAGAPPLVFQYRDPGMLATIGRNAAVARLHGISFTGFPAWVVWLVVHLIQLIGFRNRLFVLTNWAWDYFFYDRAVRLITEPDIRRQTSAG
jgi:NADH dehydrogenase